MKKLNLILASVLSLVIVLLTGCGMEDGYWNNSYTTVNDFISKDDNSSYILSEENIVYEKNSTNIIPLFTSEYSYLLTIYEDTLKTNLKPFTELYGTMQLAPNDEKKAQKQFKEFNESFESFTNALTNFKNAKTNFVDDIEITNLNSDINLQLLKEYKREFKVYINASLDMVDVFNELYENGYYNPPKESEQASQYSFNAIKFKIASIYARAQIKYIDEWTENNESNELNLFNEKAKVVYATIDSESDLSFNNYTKFKNYYSLLLNEYNDFVEALENVDLPLLESDKNAYFIENPSHQTYYEKIEFFTSLPALHF